MSSVCLLSGCGRFGELLKDYNSGEAVGADQGVLLYGRDVLATPDQDVTLWARLRTPHAFHGIEKVTIAFRHGEQTLGTAVTDKHGIATISWRPAGEGDYTIRLQPTELPSDVDREDVGALKTSYDLLVRVRKPQQKFLVTDIDGTLVENGRVNVLIRENPRQLPHAAEALQRLAGVYDIVYLTARPDELTRKTRHWLTMNRFPPGVLVTCEHPRPGGECAFKTQRLAELRRDFPALCAGVGDHVSDIDAYLANDVPAYLICPVPASKRDMRGLSRHLRELKNPDRVQAVRDWLEVESGILNQCRYSPAAYAAELERLAK